MQTCSPGMHTLPSIYVTSFLVILLQIPGTLPCTNLRADDDFWGYVTYPRDSEYYESNADDCWTLYGRNGDNLQLDLVELDVGTGTASSTCVNDYLEIKDGMPGGVEAKLCGNWDPSGKSYTSTEDVFYIRFVSMYQTKPHRGFRFKYRNAHPGSGTVKDDDGNRRLLGIIISIPILILFITICALSCRHGWRNGGRNRYPFSFLYRGREVAPEQHVHVNVINTTGLPQPPPYADKPPDYPGPPLPKGSGSPKAPPYPGWGGVPPAGAPTPGYGQPLTPAYAATGHGLQQYQSGMPGVEDTMSNQRY